jgi:hypothetical protein
MNISEASSTVRRIVDSSGSAGNTRSRSVSRHSTRSIPGEFEEEMIEITEETSRPIRKDKGKGSKKDVALDAPILEMDLSKHPYYQKEGLDNPSEVKIGSWEDLRSSSLVKKKDRSFLPFLPE